MKFSVLMSILAAGCLAFPALSAEYGVIDVRRILSESEPAKAGARHMQQVQQSLQKGMNDVLALYRGQEYTPRAQQEVAEARQTLNRQLDREQQATNAILERELQAAASEWLRSSKKAVILFPRHLAVASLDSADYTSEVMREMNRRKPVFPEIPKVTINRPAAQGTK